MRVIKLISAALAAAVLLTSCTARPQETPEPDPEPDEPVRDDTPQRPEGYTEADSFFTLNYSPDESLNPLKSRDVYNEQIFGLIYEGLFALDGNLAPYPVLCESYKTDDGSVYDIKLKSGVQFHGGGTLTASDVVYSLIIARGTSKFAARLEDISDVTAVGDLNVRITLKRPNYSLPALLDVPIIKSGDADADEPDGTGPYRRSGSRLIAFTPHRDHTDNTLGVIYLRSFDNSELAEAFAARTLDLIGYDPTGSLELNVHMLHEKRLYDTTDFIYLGLNVRRSVMSDFTVRRAMVRLVNADAICEEVFYGSVRPSNFIISPALGLYEESDASGYSYSRQSFSRLALIAGLEDVNEDGYLEHTSKPFKLRFIVNEESPRKVAAARRISTDMQNMGFNIVLDILPWDEFTNALSSGNFDMYLGEAQLRADFDFTSMLVDGGLNYGGVDNEQYKTLIDAFLAAADEESRSEAAKELCVFAAEDAAIIPIGFKQYALLTHVGVVSGAEPSQSSLFSGAAGWEITLK